MAARRAAARAAAAAAAEPPPPPAEPTPEPEPEIKEPETDKLAVPEENLVNPKSKESISKEGKVTERIIERIIICPGCQPYMSPPSPPAPPLVQPCICAGQKGGRQKKKGKKKRMDEDDGLCSHPYCIVQRARNRPQGLPWASGLYPGQTQCPPPPQQQGPPVVICQRPVLCCCRQMEDSEESEEDDAPRTDTETYMTFMNMVFAASNVMNERRDVF